MSADASQSPTPSSQPASRQNEGESDDTCVLNAAATQAAAELHDKRHAANNPQIDASLPRLDASSSLSASPFGATAAGASTPPFPANQIQFRSNTIAPSPPLPGGSPTLLDSTRAVSENSADGDQQPRYQPSPLSSGDTSAFSGLRLQTDIGASPAPARPDPNANTPFSSSYTRQSGLNFNLQHKSSASSLKPVSRTPSFKTGALANSFGSPSAASSTVPSPIISAMGDVTPLPSPLLSSDSPGPWKRETQKGPGIRLPSREGMGLQPIPSESVLVTSTGESIAAALASQNKRKTYASLGPAALDGGSEGDGGDGTATPSGDSRLTQPHTRQRSTSEYIPDPLQLPPKRMVTVSGSHQRNNSDVLDDAPQMRREPHLSGVRGLTPIEKPPTPPPSESSSSSVIGSGSSITSKKPAPEYFEAWGRYDHKRRRWRAIRTLGQGTFSRVMLATSQIASSSASDDDDDYGAMDGVAAAPPDGMLTPEPRTEHSHPRIHHRYDRRTLVAVKVCEHGPRGGASEDRVEMSLKRELEIMQSIDYPSLVHLKAWNIEPSRAILVLSYCPGGDLFDIASGHRAVLTPPLLRRIFAELIGAMRYLHARRIVHRDIKLENVLVNLTPAELADPAIDWQAYPYSVATLTDLGLSRRIADDERLETRCGSDDYAAPEVIMGQPYDGRATDAWSLGVLLYALLEARLPFDPHPTSAAANDPYLRSRSRTSHRIARVEWRWIEYAGSDGDHDADAALFVQRGLTGAMEIAEGLLKRARSRWPLEKVAATGWVSGGICIPGGEGLRLREEEEGEEVV